MSEWVNLDVMLLIWRHTSANTCIVSTHPIIVKIWNEHHIFQWIKICRIKIIVYLYVVIWCWHSKTVFSPQVFINHSVFVAPPNDICLWKVVPLGRDETDAGTTSNRHHMMTSWHGNAYWILWWESTSHRRISITMQVFVCFVVARIIFQ